MHLVYTFVTWNHAITATDCLEYRKFQKYIWARFLQNELLLKGVTQKCLLLAWFENLGRNHKSQHIKGHGGI